MPTFEERYTAWIDGKLAEDELAAFERELEAGDLPAAHTDREEAHQLGHLLRKHAGAPKLTGGEFFNHQLLERLAAEEKVMPSEVPARPSSFWSLPHLAWAAAFCLLLTYTIYLGSAPAGGRTMAPAVAGVTSPGSKEVDLAPLPSAEVVLDVRSADPNIYATTLRSEKEGLAVVWIDGLDYLPATYQLQ